MRAIIDYFSTDTTFKVIAISLAFIAVAFIGVLIYRDYKKYKKF